ncbi:PTS system, mannose-specific IIA component [Mariprofundus ferrinatatus]|uniref:PTS system, mannose-specific IIA component n=1 Tax=Mariprofundus ferrinatatus TaxID=1921087 RepID=A0A2K8L113_9PROT|nr:PTS sugar transporter subunit IIA [Mariprofundus ferrinatatus]ATX81005.1 PTS system, mannose-specific IIA component [Mariprofundus ferrinatatus]
MIGIVVIGHASIASEMRKALEHVVGEQSLIETLDVVAGDSPEQLSKTLRAMIRGCDVGEGVLLLADMFGGTPCNVAMGALEKGRVEVVSGFNLPLLIKAATLRNTVHDLSEFAAQVVESGRLYMRVAPRLDESRNG